MTQTLSQQLRLFGKRPARPPQNAFFTLTVVMIVVLAVLPWLGLNRFGLYTLCLGFIFAILALSEDLCLGWTGLFVVAPAAFFGIGAYGVAVLTTSLDWNVWPAILAAAGIAGLTALATAPALLRLSGHFLALGSLGFGVIVIQVIENWSPVTNGTAGIAGIPGLWEDTALVDLVSSESLDYLTALAALVALTAFLRRLRSSRLGLDLQAIRDDSIAASAAGIPVRSYQIGAYVTAAVIGGFAGGLYAPVVFVVTPENFSFDMSVLIIMIVVIGGRLSSVGISAAAIAMTILPEILKGWADYRMIVYSLLVLIFVLFLPDGIAGVVRTGVARLDRIRRSSKAVR